MTQNDEGWDDEAAAIKTPIKYRCSGCGGEFYRPQVKMFYASELNGGGNVRECGIFYCYDCMTNLKPEGCPLVAYDDPAQWNYLCFNCPIPELICDLRGKTIMRMVEKE